MKTSLPVGSLLTPPEIFRAAGRRATERVIAEAAGVSDSSGALKPIKKGRHPILAGMGFNWDLIKGPILPISHANALMLNKLVIKAGVLPTTTAEEVDLVAAVKITAELIEQERFGQLLLDESKPLLDRLAAFYAARTVKMAMKEAQVKSREIKEARETISGYVSDHKDKAIAILDAATMGIGRDNFGSRDSDLELRQEIGLFVAATKLKTGLAVDDASAAERGDLDAALRAIPWMLVEDNLQVLRQVGDESTARRLLQIACAGDSVSLSVEVAASLLKWNLDDIWLDDAPDWQGRSWALYKQDRFVKILNRAWASKQGRERLEPLLTGPRVRKITSGHGMPKVRKFDAFRELQPIHMKPVRAVARKGEKA